MTIEAPDGVAVSGTRADRAPFGSLDLSDPNSYGQRDLTCDLIMKGGITSGVVYPVAIAELATTYRFANIGGTSAGAIAAAAAAAAEHANNPQSFVRLAALPNELGAILGDLFRPQKSCRRLFQLVLTGTTKPETRADKVAKFTSLFAKFFGFVASRGAAAALLLLMLPLVGVGFAVFPMPVSQVLAGAAQLVLVLAGLLAVLVASKKLRSGFSFSMVVLLLVGLAAFALAVALGFWTSHRAWTLAALLLMVVVALAFAALIGMLNEAARVIPANDYGMVGGSSRDTNTGKVKPLSEWLHDLLQELAGLTSADTPLTFADLAESASSVNLTFLTTSLSQGRTYYLPNDLESSIPDERFFFDCNELRHSLPAEVVEYLETKANEVVAAARAADNAEMVWLYEQLDPLLPLPEVMDMPVVMAARMSLSFPMLISAIPLWTVDWTRDANQQAKTDWRNWRKETKAASPGQKIALPTTAPNPDKCWFSDGGIISNFPIHLFDSILPAHPTFGINLRGFAPDDEHLDNDNVPENQKIYRPTSNRGGISETWTRWEPDGFRALTGFVLAILDTIQNWSDNDQMRVPGYRDRIVHVSHGKKEGGLNLTMPPPLIERLGDRGKAAAVEFESAFADPDATVTTNWHNHRWVRFRSSMGLITSELSTLSNRYTQVEPVGVGTYQEILTKDVDIQPSYKGSKAQQQALLEIMEGVQAVAGQPREDNGLLALTDRIDGRIAIHKTANPSYKAPSPTPELRITPGHRDGSEG